ncbi:MAG: molybdenum cofactor biosynthesis protein MoaE [Mycobacterium sp.]
MSTLPIDAQALVHDVVGISDGAVVTFDGIVRDHDEGRSVTALRYSAHPTARDIIQQVAYEIASQHPDIALSVVHRVGDLAIGECALACVVASAHRAEAFRACSDLVNAVKERVPIWKEQEFADGSAEWVNAIN